MLIALIRPTGGATHYFQIILNQCIQLISQVFIQLPFLNDTFQTNYNPKESRRLIKWNTVTIKSSVLRFFLAVSG